MKKIVALSLAVAMFAFSAFAQETRKTSSDKKFKHEHKRGGHKEMMNGITLSDAQKSQLKSIREDKNLSKEDRKAKMSSVFTPDQKATFDKNKANMQAKRKEMHEKRSKEMQSKVGLSNDQMAKLKSQHDASRAQMKSIKDDKSLSKEAKHEKMKALKQQQQEQRKSFLTADQIKKMDDMKKERKDQFRKMKKESKK